MKETKIIEKAILEIVGKYQPISEQGIIEKLKGKNIEVI